MQSEYSTSPPAHSTPKSEPPPPDPDQGALPCRDCGAIDIPLIQPGKGPHAYAAHCRHCGHFIQWVSRYGAEERVARQAHFRQMAMQAQLPSHAQLAYLIDLGYRGEMPSSKDAAAVLIDELVRAKKGGVA